MRIAATINGLSSVADVTVALVDVSVEPRHEAIDPRVDVVIPSRRARPLDRVLRFAHVLPSDVHYARRRALRRTIADAVGGRQWDLVWCSRARIDLLTDGVIDGRRVVDLDDLNDLLLRSTMRQRRALRGTLRTLPRNLWDWFDAVRWSRLQRKISARVAGVAVCRSVDVAHLGVANAIVVPNGYPATTVARAIGFADRSPTIVFAGALTYEPNRLGVQWFVREVLPLVRAVVPRCRLVVVGSTGDDVATLRADGVELTGWVTDVAPYYEQARVAIAPIESGGGTRLKVIEALARRVPLVTTSFGCAGFDLRHGREALIADSPEQFASACIRLLQDATLSERLAAAGSARFVRDLSAEACERAIAGLARSVLDDDAASVATPREDT